MLAQEPELIVETKKSLEFSIEQPVIAEDIDDEAFHSNEESPQSMEDNASTLETPSEVESPVEQNGIQNEDHPESQVEDIHVEENHQSNELLQESITVIDHEETYRQALLSRKQDLLNQVTDASKAPESYLRNNNEEEKILEYADNFRQQYSRLFPSRKQLLLSPPNEFGVKKFMCSTIKPTRLPFKELYDHRSCADFVSKFIIYEPLDPCYELVRLLLNG